MTLLTAFVLPRRLCSWAVAAVLLGAALLGTSFDAAAQPTLERSGGDFVASETRTFSLSSGGAVDLQSPSGSITITSWDRSEVQVQETIRMRGMSRDEAERFVRENATDYSTSGSTLRVVARGDRNRTQHNFALRVPRRFSAELQTAGGSISASQIEGRLDARTSGGSIDVRSITGDVEIRTAGGSLEIRDVTGRANGQTAGGSIRARNVSGALDLETAGGSIEIETAGSEVTAETAGGSIRVTDVQGRLQAETAGGDIRVNNAAQSVDVETAGGDIELEGIGGDVDAETSGGDVEGRDFDGRINARTTAGDIELEDVRGGVQARTNVGDISVTMTTPRGRDYASSLHSSHGDIELVLPPDLPATLDAVVESLYGRPDREDIYSDFPFTREDVRPASDRSDLLRARGEINGGGPMFDLRSKGGSIRIEKRAE